MPDAPPDPATDPLPAPVRGDGHLCPICEATEFRPYRRRPLGRCAGCGARERTRTLYALLDRLGVLAPGRSVLHLAPEAALVPRLAQIFGARYTLADIRPEALRAFDPGIERLALDVTDPDPALRARRFDLVIHSHVMEHVRGSWPLAFLRLHALLAPGGWHVFAVPILRDWSSEDLSDLDEAARTQAFGQRDHMRYIGRHDFAADMRAIVELTGAAAFAPAQAWLDPAQMRRIAGARSVFALQKGPRSGCLAEG